MSVTAALLEPSLDTVQKTQQAAVEDRLLLRWQIEELKRGIDRNAVFASYLRQKGFPKAAERLEACGTVLGHWDCGNCGEPRKLAQTFCNQPKICPICARIERQKAVEEINLYLQAIKQRPIYGYRLRHIVLTLKKAGCNEEALRDSVTRIWTAWRKLWRNDLQATGAGAIVFVEVSPTWNVHMHVLYYGSHIKQPDLKEKWEKYTGDSKVVRIEEGSTKITEVVKYICKGLVDQGKESSGDINRLVYAVWRAFYKKNRRMSYGIFRKNIMEAWLQRPVLLPGKKDLVEDIALCPICKSDLLRYIRGNVFQRGPPTRPVLEVISE